MNTNKSIYSAAEDSPGSWLLFAISLKEAAGKLDFMKIPISKQLDSWSFSREYNLLMALSFENIIKGTIILNRMNKKLEPIDDFITTTHDLKKLAERVIECGILSFSDEELSILETFTPYIVWAGRYPVQKGENYPVVIGHQSDEYKKSLLLWEKIAENLKKEVWIIKGVGKDRFRLYFDKLKNSKS